MEQLDTPLFLLVGSRCAMSASGVSATSRPGTCRTRLPPVPRQPVSGTGWEAEMAVRAGGQGTGVQGGVCS